MRRLLLLPPTLLGITLVTFAMLHLAPGDPAAVRAGEAATPEAIAAFRAAYGLDRPAPARYAAWLGRSLTLDFGRSLVDGRPVRDKLARALPATAGIALLATLFAYLIAVPLGAAMAARDGLWATHLASALLYLVWALPLAAVALFALRAGAPWGGGIGAGVAAAGCLSLAPLVRVARHQRGALLSALRADWVRTARAKGVPARRVLLVHALRGALLPTVTLFGAELPALLSGSVVVEQVFGVRGMGLTAFDAVLARDYPMLLALATLGALLTLVGVAAADLAYALVDPRLRRA